MDTENRRLVVDIAKVLKDNQTIKQEEVAMDMLEDKDYDLTFNSEVLKALKEMKRVNNNLKLSNIELSKKMIETTKVSEDTSELLKRMMSVNKNMAKKVDDLSERVFKLERQLDEEQKE